MLKTAIQQIIEQHQPVSDDEPHWANQRFCAGCRESIQVWPYNDYPKHQSELIADHVRNTIGACR
jgi:hypothetical protein